MKLPNNFHKKHTAPHRKVMEKYLGRPLTSIEVVHHIDGNHFNNNMNNLMIMTLEEHTSLHHAGSKREVSKKYIPHNKTKKRIINQINKLAKKGLNNSEISRLVGVSSTTVKRYIKCPNSMKLNKIRNRKDVI